MSTEHSLLRRLPITLRPDPTRVLVRPFLPAAEPKDLIHPDACRLTRLTSRILAMTPAKVEFELSETIRLFSDRHSNIETVFDQRYAEVRRLLASELEATAGHRRLIGAYFSHEYSFEAAALFNPSIVPHPNQDGLGSDELRFILSLRATGEGHVSSICFRSGVVGADGNVRLDPAGRYATTPLHDVLHDTVDEYDVIFPPYTPLAERVIFPITLKQRNGLEDARFVRLVEEDGTAFYYATYTAYSGREIAPEMLRTDDFLRFSFMPLRGDAVRNKGMALFPRRIGGRYAMLARVDGENLQLVLSDDLNTWSGPTNILSAVEPWEFVQIGNCGSPIELPEGWLVLTHGVGAMRRYCIGAVLLDLRDPTRVLGRLREPLLMPEGGEREGYVPNVVYSCGALAHAGNLVLPYAASDTATTFAVVPLRRLLAAMC